MRQLPTGPPGGGPLLLAGHNLGEGTPGDDHGRTRGGPGGLSGARSTPRADSRLPTIARARDTAEVATAHDTPLRSATGDQFSNVLTFRRRRFGFVQHAVPHSSQRRLFGVLTRPERFRRKKISSLENRASSILSPDSRRGRSLYMGCCYGMAPSAMRTRLSSFPSCVSAIAYTPSHYADGTILPNEVGQCRKCSSGPCMYRPFGVVGSVDAVP